MITIRFLRRSVDGQTARTDPNTDDILKISKLGENSVRCIYTERSSMEDIVTDTMILNYPQLSSYLYRMFLLLGLDDDPFQSVQFFIPAYPTVLIPVTTLQKHVSAIMEVIMSAYTIWPVATRQLTATSIGSPEQSSDD